MKNLKRKVLAFILRTKSSGRVERHDFLLLAPADTPDAWQFRVQGVGEDAGDLFGFCWLDGQSLARVDEEHRPFISPDYVPELFAI